MCAMTRSPSAKLDFDLRAEEYARHRKVHPGVAEAFIASGLVGSGSRVLDVGCGTGNYAVVLTAASNCRISGIDPSANMLDRARDAVPWESLSQGSAEILPFPGGSFDVVMTTDVIHHIQDRTAYFREAARVLRSGGHIVTVTDSRDDIPRRRPLSSHFPETVDVELRRYPPVPLLLRELADGGFDELRLSHVEHAYELADIQPYRDRAFSSLHLIDEGAFRRGIKRLEGDLASGPISCISLYTIICGMKPGETPNCGIRR